MNIDRDNKDQKIGSHELPKIILDGEDIRKNLPTEEKKLPVMEIIFGALFFTIRNYKTLLRSGIPFFIFTAFLMIFLEPFFLLEGSDIYKILVLLFLGVPLYFVLLVISVIGFHRTFLLNIETKIFRWGWRETKYIGWWLALSSLPIILPVILMLLISFFGSLIFMPHLLGQGNADGMIPSVGSMFSIVLLIGAILYAFLLYMVARWSLVLPATAIDRNDVELSLSWNLTSKNGWRLVFLIGFFPLLSSLIMYVLPDVESIFYSVLVFSVWAVVFIIEVALLSLSYDYLSKNSNVVIVE